MVLVLAFSYGLAHRTGRSLGGRTLIVLLILNGIAAMFAAIFQAAWGEAEIEPSILGDSVHQLAARLGFMALTAAMLLFPGVVWTKPEWRGFLWVLSAVPIFALFAGLLFILKVFPDYSGIVQRTFFVMCGVWLEVVAIQLIRLK